MWKRGEIAPEEQFLLFSAIFFYLLWDFHVQAGTRFSVQDKWLFKISEIEVTSQLFFFCSNLLLPSTALTAIAPDKAFFFQQKSTDIFL